MNQGVDLCNVGTTLGYSCLLLDVIPHPHARRTMANSKQQTANTDVWMGVCRCLPVCVCVRQCSASVSVFLARSKDVRRTVCYVSTRLAAISMRAELGGGGRIYLLHFFVGARSVKNV